MPSPLGFRGSGAVAAFSIVGIGFDVHDIPTPQTRPEIAIGDGKPGKGIDRDPQPRGSLFPAQIAPGRDVGFKGRFRVHGLKGFPGFFANLGSHLFRYGFPIQTRNVNVTEKSRKIRQPSFFPFRNGVAISNFRITVPINSVTSGRIKPVYGKIPVYGIKQKNSGTQISVTEFSCTCDLSNRKFAFRFHIRKLPNT